MGLSPHLAVTLFCFLICTGNGIHGCNDSPLREIINTLNQVTEKGTPCTEMFVPDVLTATRRSCTVNESTLTTLKDFLESLKSILRGKYLQSCTSMS
ncbi:interleukin 4, isoform CRA_b [Rattus norvegicus]|uniref:Interleukin-4 n=2 Tax=Rattus norvegicus TaxID=10116 RepID=A6HED5_RAT|nr:interleukin 4, isoform CRA_b [Rattus norvegicus]